jgi:hypothetical protein
MILTPSCAKTPPKWDHPIIGGSTQSRRFLEGGMAVERRGMHAALKRIEDEREREGNRCTPVAQKPESSRESEEPEAFASKSLH